MQPLVLDTNVVLDVFVFGDAAARPVREGLEAGRLCWVATAAMREELGRVLAYPQLGSWLARSRLEAADVLAAFDRHVRPVAEPPRAPLACRDPDDQKFIDLAVARRACLLSKDRAVLALRRRLAAHGVQAAPTLG